MNRQQKFQVSIASFYSKVSLFKFNSSSGPFKYWVQLPIVLGWFLGSFGLGGYGYIPLNWELHPSGVPGLLALTSLWGENYLQIRSNGCPHTLSLFSAEPHLFFAVLIPLDFSLSHNSLSCIHDDSMWWFDCDCLRSCFRWVRVFEWFKDKIWSINVRLLEGLNLNL